MSQDARTQEEQNTQRRAQILGLQYFDTATPGDRPIYKELIPKEEMYAARVIPLRVADHDIVFGITNTTSQQALSGMQHRFMDQRVTYNLISDTGFREYMALYDPPKEVIYHDISLHGSGDSEELIRSVSTTLEQVNADDMLAYLVKQAHRLNASDIHLESFPEHIRIRFRTDGVLHPVARLSMEKYHILVSAIASAANISTSANEPQQGHIAQKVVMADNSTVDVNVRLETTPTVNTMDIVMRLFNMNQEMYNLDRLGLSVTERAVVDSIINKPSGLVLAVGPTGSGKTTTLYSMLNSLNSEERKIVTIEDPVEYQFDGITQIPVNSKSSQEMGFAEKLRAVLRLDPDVVMIGEIRDMDTAKTALQASLTGHLVLSTFHASSAAAALTRLVDIISQNPLFMSAIRLVMAQRLVRHLDDTTKQPYHPDDATLVRIQQVIDSLPASIERPRLDNIQLYRPGSSPENPYGYRGQIALREQFVMSDEIRQLFEKGTNLSVDAIEAAAIRGGMRTILQDGILKAIAGETSLEEIIRVVG